MSSSRKRKAAYSQPQEPEPQCFDFVQFSDIDIKEYLKEDQGNFVFILKSVGQSNQAVCATIDRLNKGFTDRSLGFYECNKSTNPWSYGERLFRINVKEVNVVVPDKIVREAFTLMLMTPIRILYLVYAQKEAKYTISQDTRDGGTYVSADHCQEGTDKKIYYITGDYTNINFWSDQAKKYPLWNEFKDRFFAKQSSGGAHETSIIFDVEIKKVTGDQGFGFNIPLSDPIQLDVNKLGVYITINNIFTGDDDEEIVDFVNNNIDISSQLCIGPITKIKKRNEGEEIVYAISCVQKINYDIISPKKFYYKKDENFKIILFNDDVIQNVITFPTFIEGQTDNINKFLKTTIMKMYDDINYIKTVLD